MEIMRYGDSMITVGVFGDNNKPQRYYDRSYPDPSLPTHRTFAY